MPDLQAVDHDPFAPPVTVPVDHDPFAPQAAFEAAAARVRAPYARANARVSGLPDVGTVLGNKLVNTLMAGPNLMGQVAEGSVDPNSPEAIRRSADVAASTLGYGMLGARPGAAGMAGGRLTQPAAIAEGAAKTGGLGDFIQAYHGSPHDFDRFDLSKIGTGEGAQAYGHGLYFAENEGVAKGYKEGLSPKAKPLSARLDNSEEWYNAEPKDRAGMNELWGRISPYNIKTDADAARILARSKGDLEKTLKNIDSGSIKVHPADEEGYREALRLLNQGRVTFDAPKEAGGKMYQVAIKAPPEHFLDWDKPLSEQHPKVQRAINKVVTDAGRTPVPEQTVYDQVVKAARAQLGKDGLLGTADPQLIASHKLSEAGIPGIKYLDQGSRAPGGLNRTQLQNKISVLRDDVARSEKTGEGNLPRMREILSSHENALAAMKPETRNYVVFDDKLIDIMKKYGIAGIGALPALNAYTHRTQSIDHDPFAQ
jgi:hypothetical protein